MNRVEFLKKFGIASILSWLGIKFNLNSKQCKCEGSCNHYCPMGHFQQTPYLVSHDFSVPLCDIFKDQFTNPLRLVHIWDVDNPPYQENEKGYRSLDGKGVRYWLCCKTCGIMWVKV